MTSDTEQAEDQQSDADAKQKRTTIKDLETEIQGLKLELTSKNEMLSKVSEQITQLQTDFTRINKQNTAGQMIQRFSIINERINTLATGIVCLLLTHCRGINDIGWETNLKRYWKTTGRVVYPEDKVGVKWVIDNEDPLEVINKFLEMSFDK